MKARLNLTIDNITLSQVKKYAESINASVSELVEHYFESIIKSHKRKNIIEMIDKLKKPSIKDNIDLKKEFYQAQSGKYGF